MLRLIFNESGIDWVKILLADDHALFSEGFALLIKQYLPQAECLVASSFQGLHQLLEAHDDVDLLLVDWNMPGMQGLTSIRYLQQHYQSLPICVISAEESPAQIELVLKTGISGYIPKSLDGDLMRLAMEKMLAGEVYKPPLHQPFSAFGYAKTFVNSVNTCQLTKRQLEVLSLLAVGWSDKAISRELGVTPLTLRSHLKEIFRRLEVNNRMEAANKARQLGFF